MRLRILAAVAVLALVPAGHAVAHGVGARGDLPIPKDFFLYAAALTVVLSFFIAAIMWPEARLARTARGRPLGRWAHPVGLVTSSVGRMIGMLGFIVVMIAAWGAPNDPGLNIAPVAIYVVLWVLVPWSCALVGGVWRALNPWDTIAMYASGRVGPPPDPSADGSRWIHSFWPAVLGLFAFQWLELAHPDPGNTKVLAVAFTVYSAIVLAAAARWGRAWLQTGEAFTVLFSLIAAIAPLGRRGDGRWVLRWPFSGLAEVAPRRGLAAVVLCVIGGTTFDGVSRSQWYIDLFRDTTGWERSAYATIGLILCIAAVSAAYFVAVIGVARIGGRDRVHVARSFAPSLVPIALAYSVAHYFSLVVFEGQTAWSLLSDPYGQGWDLFGTASGGPDYTAVGTTPIALVQTAAIVIGHVAAVIVAHDRALAEFGRKRATSSQVPLLAVMVGLTIMGLTLLLSA